jgi:hypothetical protein
MIGLNRRFRNRETHIPDTHVIAGMYRGLLNREPDPHGMAQFIESLRKGAAVEDVVRDIVRSPEFQNKQRGS